MTRRALRVALLAGTVALAGCSDDPGGQTAPSGALRVYVSVPEHGTTAATGRAVAAGARLALRDARGRAGGRRVKMVVLPSTRPGDARWDPGTVEANAKRAADDPRAVAYVGETDRGASAVSVPRTNQEDLLQVSPLDGLTSLTRTPRGRPRAGPERYYPAERRTFVRLVPPDSYVAQSMLALDRAAPGGRTALVDTPDFAARELGAILDAGLRRRTASPVAHELLKDEPEAAADAVRAVAAARPDTVLVSGEPGPVASRLLAQLRRQLPGAKVVASPALAGLRGSSRDAVAVTPVLPPSAVPARGRRVLDRLGRSGRAEALYGYDAMALVLAAIRAGEGDRRAIVRSAFQTRIDDGAAGELSVGRLGEVDRDRLAVVPLGDGGRVRLIDR